MSETITKKPTNHIGNRSPVLIPGCTKGDVYAAYSYNTARASIQTHARRSYQRSGGIRECYLCGYDKYVEVAHRRAIKNFTMDALLSDINHPDNLVMLCPNHHREADKGEINLLDETEMAKYYKERPVPLSKDSVTFKRTGVNQGVWIGKYRKSHKQETFTIGTLEQFPTINDAREAMEQFKKTDLELISN